MEEILSEVESPCIGVCSIDEISQLCQGCYRTLSEIQQWWDLNTSQKQLIIAQLAARESKLFE